MRKRDQERQRLAVARILLCARRPLVLADSPLLEEAAVARLARERYADGILAEERALSDLGREAGEAVLRRMGEDPRLERERVVLAEVLAGASVWSAARKLGVSREHLSNSAWRSVTAWVLDEFEVRCREAMAKGPTTRAGVRVLS